MKKQKLVVIHGTCKDVCWAAVKSIPHDFNLKYGDELTLLGVLHVVNKSSSTQAGKLFRCGKKWRLHSVFGYDSITMEEEVAKKKEDYYKQKDLLILRKECEMEKIKFNIELTGGPSRKEVAAKAAINLGATWVVLDREMKKHRRYFMEKLSCGISRLKRDNSIPNLRGPISIMDTSKSKILYDEMIPGESSKELFSTSPSERVVYSKHSTSNDINNLEEFEKCSSLLDLLNEANKRSKPAATKETTPSLIIEDCQTEKVERSQSITFPAKQRRQDVKESVRIDSIQGEEAFMKHKCSICGNVRPQMEWHRDFSYSELYEATEGFSMKNFLSKGGFGSVYRGKLENDMQIAVKHHKYGSHQGEKEFKSEVDILSKARHYNLVMLLGTCSEGTHKLLVYEFVCYGSLDKHLSHDTKVPLTWEKRLKIALGAAKGLDYLHSQNIIHRDMNSNNILITHDHEALLGDFGLAKMQKGDSIRTSSHRVVGTVGYLAPEYAQNGEVSTKMDVYSFGVVLLQLITGLAMKDNELQGKSLVEWATPLIEDWKYQDLADKRITDACDLHQLLIMVQIAGNCLSNDPDERWTMRKVVKALTDIIGEGNAI